MNSSSPARMRRLARITMCSSPSSSASSLAWQLGSHEWLMWRVALPPSAPQGATILSAPDPAAAMTQNEASVLSHQGGITASPSLSDEALAKVRANTELFNQLGADSVPLILYKNARTGAYGSYSGSLQTDQLVAMVGL
jgi:thiol:disulfide interchange protein DsbG